MLAGVDGCRAGWLCVTLDVARDELAHAVFPNAEALLMQQPLPDVIAVDIPIGLPAAGARDCDRLARRRLGRRGSSVFPAPLRPMLDAVDYARACAIGAEIDGKRISKQAWNIVAKVREVDRVLRAQPSVAARVVEVHPELSFATWNRAPLEFSKKCDAGLGERRALIAGHFGPDAVAAIRSDWRVTDVAHDDIVDAFAALWTAQRIGRGAAESLPPDPPLDAARMPMRIVT